MPIQYPDDLFRTTSGRSLKITAPLHEHFLLEHYIIQVRTQYLYWISFTYSEATNRYLAIWRPVRPDPCSKGADVACAIRQAVTSLISINYAYQRAVRGRFIIIRRDKLALAMTPVWLATVLEGRNVCLDGHTD